MVGVIWVSWSSIIRLQFHTGVQNPNGVSDSALRALSTLRGLRGAPEVPPLCRETQSLGQQIKNW